MRVVFMGTPGFAVPTLMEIVGQGHDVVAVYTQPPRRAGRGMEERQSPVHMAADALGLEVRHPTSLKGRAGEVADLGADVLVVVAYGLILPKEVLEGAPMGAFNVHASLLPRWRGAAPIARAVMAGDEETGVGIMKMDEGLDTGPVAMEERIAIGPTDTAGELTERLSRLGADLMVRALGGLMRGTLVLTPQPDAGATYAKKIEKAETAIDFNQPAQVVQSHINGLSPWPGAHATIALSGKDERVKVLLAEAVDAPQSAPSGTIFQGEDNTTLTVACGKGAVRLHKVQRAGKGVVSAQEFLRGARLDPGATFGV